MELLRVKQENWLWQSQVKELEMRLDNLTANKQPQFVQTYFADELFSSLSSIVLSEPAQSLIREIVPKLKETEKTIIVASHCNNVTIPSELQSQYSSISELSLAKAKAVANLLASWGIPKERFICIGYNHKPNKTTEASLVFSDQLTRLEFRNIDSGISTFSRSDTVVIDSILASKDIYHHSRPTTENNIGTVPISNQRIEIIVIP